MSRATPQRDWRVAVEDRPKVTALARALNVPRLVAHLLTVRGVETVDEGLRFLAPSLEQLSDPFLLTDVRAAVDRIRQARDRAERVLVFGDYDMDGIAGSAILVNALRRFGVTDTSYAMPNRLTEGYGITPEHVESARDQGVGLIITVDNGIAAYDAARAAKTVGIDLIVTDHHEFEGAIPEAVAVINPKREGPGNPSADACGAAVALKLAWALTGELADLDLAAFGTIADVVPLRGENRVIAALGLEHAVKSPRLGLLKLAQVAGVRLETLRASDVAFQLAPRINAGGRVGDGLIGLRLLLLSPSDPDASDEAAHIASELDAANAQRRDIENRILEEATTALDSTFHPEQRSIVLASRSWHPGVVGIVATRLQASYYRPVVLVAVNESGEGRGSARSIEEFDLAQALAACKDHLIRCGGHRAAAGLTIQEDRIAAFREAFEAEAARRLPPGDLKPSLEIAAQVALSELTSRLVQTIERLQPFGHANPSPLFCSYGVRPLPNSAREVGGGTRRSAQANASFAGHLRFTVQEGPTLLNVIGFRMADRLDEVSHADSLDIAFTPRLDTWRDETSVQLVLKDVRQS